MATVTIRNLPDDVIKRIKQLASEKGHSMEQEIRDLLETRYAAKIEVANRIRQRWQTLPETTSEEVNNWRSEGRARDY